MSNRRSAFTLFEIMISLMIMTVTILAVVLIVPVGLRSQQHSRATLYASAVGISLLESFHNPLPSIKDAGSLRFQSTDRIAQRLRGMGVYSAPFQSDLERYLSRPFSGGLPMPVEIANRLDSDDGEIKDILRNRGRLYYADPMFVRNLMLGATRDGAVMGTDLPPELHKLVFGVTGYAQENALIQHPQDGWPLHEVYPFPPNWLTYQSSQKRKGPVALPAPYNIGRTMSSSNAAQMYGDGGLDSWAWPGDTSPGLVSASIEGSTPGDNSSGVGYHGRHWLHFKNKLGGKWSNGWNAFLDVAGNIKGGWLPIRALINPSSSYVSAVSVTGNTMSPGKTLSLATYEMRANYRDRALDLWNAVKPATLPTLVKTSGVTVSDVRIDLNSYEYPPDQLRQFTPTDPYSLSSIPGEFPPHPTQVLALSYLAHAAMMVAGDLPPWSSTVWNNARSQSSTSTFSPFFKDLNGNEKDVKYLAVAAAAGSTTVQLKDSNATEIRLYALDYLWFEEDASHVYRVKDDVLIASGSVGVVTLDKRYKVQGNGEILDEDAGSATGALHAALGSGKRALRVANDADRAFARKVHEMCMRWAMCYASENPYDWGAPRPANRQVMTDKPIGLFDLFWDAGPYTDATRVSGNAARSMVKQYTQEESRYRWIIGRNRRAPAWATPVGGNANELTHVGPFDANSSNWNDLRTQLVTGRYKAPAAGGASSASFANADEQRYWLNRSFEPLHRTRKLVFWSVDWKSYEDAESVMSAPMDMSAYGQSPANRSGDGWMFGSDSIGGEWALSGNAEGLYVWDDANRKRRWCDTHTGDNDWYIAKEGDRDLILGHWGADRNNNGRLDIGPIPKTTRMRAVKICDFMVYDPVLRLHVGN